MWADSGACPQDYTVPKPKMPLHLPSTILKPRLQKTIILGHVSCGCETQSLTLWEEHKLQVYENRVLMKVFTPKEDAICEQFRILCNEEPSDLDTVPGVVRIMKCGRGYSRLHAQF
jgi:hypothetical protein